ncbi:glycosyltransferase [Cerasibacillus terrae]|uniref:Glycosyltransferase n=1 Tax=Cerasibacillus terrae TaxID=2498845 RepID=A0A5C8P093_9BACI|nr:glycosyltransferase family 2 protein [Cerasibacillus terrae]TXL66676.1 glycosyltransferase [Cerasibacillus terrae]
MLKTIKKIAIGPIDWFIYTVLNEKQRKALSNLFPEDLKDKLKKLTSSGKNRAQRYQLKQIKHHLYNLGFMEKGLKDLQSFYEQTTDPHMKRLIAWELALWYANDYSKPGAKQALTYLTAAEDGEKDKDQLRCIAIMKAECYDMLNRNNEGKQVLHKMLEKQEHHDLYLALANLEETLEGRLTYFNKVMDMYSLAPIMFQENGRTYDDLRTFPMEHHVAEGPKVSIILPAYKAENGIQTAIESILTQTWQNLELLIVDDCSPDNTLEVIKSYAKKDNRIKYFQTPSNSGPYVARNIALQHATGEFVTVNDADDWSHREKVEKQVTHLLKHEDIIANTSGHARLTEDLKVYRRGTPGKYIFPNMSSLMFRRKPVMEKLGSWDSVRFAADGEFKRRIIQAFGKDSVVDLDSGPLSLPRQSVTSLTASSAFGYNGFFMGARKEYVESFTAYHQTADSLYYPYPQDKRPYPVPEPMWPTREEKQSNARIFDRVIVADFSHLNAEVITEIKGQSNLHERIGLVQLHIYNVTQDHVVHPEIRKLIDGKNIHMLVYGEKIKTQKMVLFHPAALKYEQKYIPEIQADDIFMIVKELEEVKVPLYMKQIENHFKSSNVRVQVLK